MADPLTIIGLTASIVQFIDVGYRFIKATKEIYDSVDGANEEIVELRAGVEKIKTFSREVSSRWKGLSAEELTIKDLAGECEQLADSLLRKMKSLETRTNAKSRTIESARVAWKTFLARKDLDEWMEKLIKIERQLRENLETVLQRNNQSSIMRVLGEIDRQYALAGIEISSNLASLRHSIERASIRQSQGAKEYRMSLNQLSSGLTGLIQEVQAADKYRQIITSLLFTTMKRRHDQIHNAHFKTLSWVYDPSKTTLMDWINQGNGIYWITGQAGSGKSTLMKYIAQSPEVRQGLEAWAGNKTLYTASFYFWNPGVSLQKSQLGLLQSMLYQILRTDPNLVTDVCPNHPPLEPWDIAELKAAFETLVATKMASARFCFFVDGLDEFEGPETEIMKVLHLLARSTNLKICASSRPWPAFESALKDDSRMLTVHDLTKEDMAQYVESMLVENDVFKELAARDARCQDLILRIATMANGVWLWVFLVVRDLKKDITARETYSILEARVNSLPRELSDYFTRMMDRIDPLFREQTACIFSLCIEAVRPFPSYALAFFEIETAEPDYALSAELKPIESRELERISGEWKIRLQSRCADLLKVHYHASPEVFYQWPVEFLHRTVRDFLRDNHRTKLLEAAPSNFNVKISLCRMILVLLKKLPLRDFRRDNDTLLSLVDELLYYANELEQLGMTQEIFPLLDMLDQVMRVQKQVSYPNYHAHWTNAREMPGNGKYIIWKEQGGCSWPALAIQARLTSYVRYVLDRDPSHLSKPCRPLLDYALRPARATSVVPAHTKELAMPNTGMVQLLLDRGCNPNQTVGIYGGESVWGLFVLFCYEKLQDEGADQGVLFRVTNLLVAHRASMNWRLVNRDTAVQELLQEVLTQSEISALVNTQQNTQLRVSSPGWWGWISGALMGGR
ncbi:hypothetical protein BDW59DRAFT_146785 [Aspergillus cavernicola]|uniref:NACHT domain-containing protein n=1 Tax=Aspergillus cavernicola TaxID=176166 RepID=A0ABR4IBJ2_9EURO